uniref:Uncharacterized protein n=1 Tax=Aegilops tauschii subsp. strangulata TaxID=200361 RepID=A0A453MPH9_AEGTS
MPTRSRLPPRRRTLTNEPSPRSSVPPNSRGVAAVKAASSCTVVRVATMDRSGEGTTGFEENYERGRCPAAAGTRRGLCPGG